MTTDERSREFERALLAMDRVGARSALTAATGAGSLMAVTEGVVAPALERIGDAWAGGDIALAQLYMAGRIAEEVVTAILPATYSDPSRPPAIAIAVLEDHHALGKRLVLSSLRASGHTVTDYGHGVPVDTVLERCRRERPRILLLSTLMLPSALAVRRVVDGLARLDPHPVVVVGGAPFRLDAELWREVGADAMGLDSSDAVALVDRFLGGAS